jgi:signal transduction histidine kinase
MLELIALVFAVAANLLLGLFVYLKNSKSATNRAFFFLTVSFVLWSSVNYLSVHPRVLPQIILVRLVLLFATLLCYSVYLTFSVFPGHSFINKRQVRAFGVWAAVVMGLTLTPFVFRELTYVDGKAQPVVGPGVAIFGLTVAVFLGTAIFYIFRKFRNSKGRERLQFRLVLLGIAGSFSLIFVTNFLFVVLFQVTTLIPFGASFSLVFTGALAYAIVRQHLFDIRAVVARSLAYVLLLGSLGGVYSLGLFGASALFLGENPSRATLLFLNMALALILTFTFQPLRRFFERVTDKIFFRDRYDSQKLLNPITQTLASEIDLDIVLEKTLEMIGQAVRVNFGQYIIFEKNQVYKIEHYGRLPEQVITTPELKNLNQSMLVADELEAGRRKEVMDKHGIRLSLVLRTKDEFVGFLLLGDKLSGDIYSTQDLELFEILANELAVAIVNAKAYEEIAQFNVTLQDKVNQATANLRVANKHLKELDQAKDEFISMASHQLRTPLTTIKGYISMLQEGDAGKMTGEQAEFLQYAYSGSERMVSLISDLLNVSRMNSGKFMIEAQAVNIVDIISDEVRQLQSHAEAKKLKLIWKPPTGKFPLVEVDENKTRQVIMNFIDNAIYYTKTGSVTVALKLAGDNFELRVTDTGIGVPPEAKAKLFGKFFRAGNAQQVRPDGTGLGLYLAKRVIEDQGGSIIFDSTEGKGSTFGFTLPIKATKSQAKPAKSPAVKVAVSG